MRCFWVDTNMNMKNYNSIKKSIFLGWSQTKNCRNCGASYSLKEIPQHCLKGTGCHEFTVKKTNLTEERALQNGGFPYVL